MICREIISSVVEIVEEESVKKKERSERRQKITNEREQSLLRVAVRDRRIERSIKLKQAWVDKREEMMLVDMMTVMDREMEMTRIQVSKATKLREGWLVLRNVMEVDWVEDIPVQEIEIGKNP